MQEIIQIPQILLPNTEDLAAWATIACDQFTSNEEYWENERRRTENKPSAFHLVLPEIYLKDNPEERISKIHAAMNDYLQNGVFQKLEKGFILVERQTLFSTVPRFGLLLAVDLEAYSFAPGNHFPIRATEETVTSRIPPRVAVRKGAPIELPHSLLLYNDPEKKVLFDLIAERGTYKKLYDFSLDGQGGKLKGYFIPEEKSKELVERFYSLVGGRAAFDRGESPMLFAVGDGNHSLAAAKACWEEKKETLSEEERKVSPARFALTEAVNLFDESIIFYPIHRYVKVDNAERFLENLETYTAAFSLKEGVVRFKGYYDVPELIRKVDSYANAYLEANGGDIDFIHSEEELCRLVRENENSVGIVFQGIDKAGFFDFVSRNSTFPRKTFSMGQGAEKRYYLEAKEIL